MVTIFFFFFFRFCARFFEIFEQCGERKPATAFAPIHLSLHPGVGVLLLSLSSSWYKETSARMTALLSTRPSKGSPLKRAVVKRRAQRHFWSQTSPVRSSGDELYANIQQLFPTNSSRRGPRTSLVISLGIIENRDFVMITLSASTTTRKKK